MFAIPGGACRQGLYDQQLCPLHVGWRDGVF